VRLYHQTGLCRRALGVVLVVVGVVAQQEDALRAIDDLDARLRMHL